uniref:Uncharacterized protein n=1 Tax=Rhizophora mucronata TaxID=61149 RepID=A0A2P2N6M3_RHIMU
MTDYKLVSLWKQFRTPPSPPFLLLYSRVFLLTIELCFGNS